MELNFTKLIATKVNYEGDLSDTIEHYNDLFSNLKKFEAGTKNEPGEGYVDLKVDTEDEFYRSEKGNLINILITKRHKKEIYKDVEIIENGELSYEKALSYQNCDIFWLFPDLMVIRGPENETDKSFEAMKEILDSEIKMEIITLPHDFFMWLSCISLNKTKKGKIDSDLTINKIFRDETIFNSPRSAGRIGTKTSVIGSSNAIISPQTLAAIAGKHEFSKIRALFTFDDFRIDAQLCRFEGIHIYSHYKNFTDKRVNVRFLYSLLFLRKIFEVYKYWKTLDNNEKYPSEKCLEEMFKELEQQIDNSLKVFKKDIMREYDYKRLNWCLDVLLCL